MSRDKAKTDAYRCPLCGSVLSQAHFQKVIKLQKGQQSALAKFRKQADAAKTQIRELRSNTKRQIQAAKNAATLSERSKNDIRLKRVSTRIAKLEEENKMLKKHTSPQEIGLADEAKLVARLKKEFPEDF